MFSSVWDEPQFPTVKKRVGKRKYVEYINIANAFDIETTSSYINGEKRAHANVFIIDILDQRKIVRNMEEFVDELRELSKVHELSHDTKRCVIYVHNLAYEFQFIKKYLDIIGETVFSLENTRKIVKFNTYLGFEFRCSYTLTGLSLANWGDKLGVLKMVGDYDYKLQRNPLTPLTDKEIGYSYGDIDVIKAGINEYLKTYDITNLPMTKTSFTRIACRDKVLSDKKYQRLITSLTLDLPLYFALRDAYQGGLTRANPLHVGKILNNVIGFDLASSYPASLVLEKYPMSTPVQVYPNDERDLQFLCEGNAVLMTITIENVVLKREFAIMSLDKSITEGYKEIDNGRIVMAEKVILTCTEIDYQNYKDYYNFDLVKIGLCYIFKKDYLPKSLVEFILDLYSKKTTLKDVKEEIEEYSRSKEHINSVYGMMVSSLLHSVFIWNGSELIEQPQDREDHERELEENEDSKNKFLYYPWGVWCTAHSRRTLLNLNMRLEDNNIEDYYCDTDSRYFDADNELYKSIIDNLNNDIKNKIQASSEHFDLPIELYQPQDIYGNAHPIGVWEYDGTYEEFKTLGAKRYAGYKGGELSITVAGLNKKLGAKYVHENGGLDFFKDGMTIPKEYSGRTTATYIDDEYTFEHSDYLGNKCEINSRSSLHLEESEYQMKIGVDYKEFLSTIREVQELKNIF